MRIQQFPWSKRCLPSVLAASLLFGSVPAVGAAAADQQTSAVPQTNANAAAPNISREAAIQVAKNFVSVPEGYKGPEVAQRRNYGRSDQTIWEVSWRQEVHPYGHISVTIDAGTGVILGLDQWDNGERTGSFPPKVSYEQSVEIARQWLQKLYPDQSESFAYDEQPDQEWGKVLRNPRDTYQVTFHRVVNGVPFPNQTLNFMIDGDGNLRGLHYNVMGNVTFQSKENVLSEEDIRQKMDEQLQMKLAYLIDRERSPERETNAKGPLLTYVPAVPVWYVDAKTGELLWYDGQVWKPSQQADQPIGEKRANGGQAERKSPVNEQEAMRILQQNLEIPEDVTIRSVELRDQDYWSDGASWHIQFEYSHENGGVGWTGGIIDAETGRLLHYELTPYLEEKNRREGDGKQRENQSYPVSREKAEAIALSYVKAKNADRQHELYPTMTVQSLADRDRPYYRFAYERRVNGIAVLGDQVEVSVSAETGKVVSYSERWLEDVSFPQAGDVADAEEVKRNFLQDLSLHLEYAVLDNYSPVREPRQWQARLVYRAEQPWKGSTYIDAHTGKVMDMSTGQEATRRTVEKQGVPEDIVGHFAEKELAYLLQVQALQPEAGKVMPDKKVTRGEFVDMLLRTTGYIPPDPSYLRYRFADAKPTFDDVGKDHRYFAAVELAVERNLLGKQVKAFRPDQNITREEAAELLVDALGYEKLADLDNLYQLPFADKEVIRLKGHVAIASKLGLINGMGNEYRPRAELTRAEVAVILFRFLEKRSEYAPTPRVDY